MKTSIIVAIRYRADLTQVCIDSILKYTKDFELILVQEGEDVEIKTLLESYVYSYPQTVKYVQNKVPKGYSGALNAGLAVAKGDYYCFMNNDTVVTPKWMDEMLQGFKYREDVGLVAPTFWGMGNRQSIEWNNGKPFDLVVSPFDLTGVCFLISKECLDKVGYWDESFGHGGEDFDMTIRVQKAGYSMVIARNSFIYHYGGASTRIIFNNDLATVRANQEAKLTQLELKHNMDIKSKFSSFNAI